MKIRAIICVILFLACIAIPIAAINHVPGKVSVNENRYLATFPRLFDENGKFVAKGLRGGIESWLNDNIGFREYFASLYGNVKYRVFHDSPSSRVEIGRDGWFFYTLDDNLKIADGSYPLSDSDIEKIAEVQTQISEFYRKQGVDYVLALPPSKVSVYPEHIASGKFAVRETPVDKVSQYLMENTQVKVIPLKDALLAAKEEGQVFFKTDSHWNETGAYAGYQEIVRKMNQYGVAQGGPAEVEFVPGAYRGEFSAMFGDEDMLGEEDALESEITNQMATKVEAGEWFDQLQEIKVRHNVRTPSFIYSNVEYNGKKALMYGDSKFGQWNLPELLAENFNEFTFIWSYDMNNEFVEAYKPDVVIYEMTERYLSTLPEYNAHIYMEGLAQ